MRRGSAIRAGLARAWAERRSPPLLAPGPALRALGPVAALTAALAAAALAGAVAAERAAAAREAGFGRAASVVVAGPARAVEAALEVLATTPGVVRAEPAGPVEGLPGVGVGPAAPAAPVLIAVTLGAEPPDAAALAARLAAEAPGALYDDHAAWRGPLIEAAREARWLGRGAAVATVAAGLAVVGWVAAAAASEAGAGAALLRRMGATRRG